MTRRPKGSGSVYNRPQGGFQLRWWQNGRKRSKTLHCSEAEAHATLDHIQAALAEEGALCGHSNLIDFGRRYLDRFELDGNRSASTARSRFALHIETAHFAEWPLQDITSGHIRRWLDDLGRKGLAAQTIRHCAYLLSGIMRDAAERELVSANPVAAVRKPRVKTTRRDRYLSVEEIERLCGPEELHPVRWAILALIGTGLRSGELLGLSFDDLHLDASSPHLIVRRSGRRTNSTKTGGSRRVELFGIGLEAVKGWLEVRPSLSIKRFDMGTLPWVFAIPKGWLRGDDRLGEVFAAVGIEDIHAHDLRGTHATHLLSGTWGHAWTIAEVAQQLGDTVSTTQHNYATIVPSALAAAAHRTGRAIDGTQMGRRLSPPSDDKPLESLSRRDGIRTCDHRLVRPSQSSAISLGWVQSASELRPKVSFGSCEAIARRYLALASTNDPRTHEAACELASEAAEATATLLEICEEIEQGGKFWDRRANELAALFLGFDIDDDAPASEEDAS